MAQTSELNIEMRAQFTTSVMNRIHSYAKLQSISANTSCSIKTNQGMVL